LQRNHDRSKITPCFFYTFVGPYKVMAQFNVLSKQCPLCRELSVESIRGSLRIRPPTHRCANCGAELKTTFSRSALWSVPVAVIALSAMYIAITWLQQSQAVTGVVRAGLIGGIVALAFSIPGNIALRGIVFCPFKP
jgi:hypothetical protein